MKVIATLILTTALSSADTDYVIAVSGRTAADAAWQPVVEKLKAKHHAETVMWNTAPAEILPLLQKSLPRYVCFVAPPDETTREFVQTVHRLMRRLDDDVLAFPDDPALAYVVGGHCLTVLLA